MTVRLLMPLGTLLALIACAILWFAVSPDGQQPAEGATQETAAPASALATGSEPVIPKPVTESPVSNLAPALDLEMEDSLWTAFEQARRSIQKLNEHESSLPQNKGVHFFAFNPQENLTVRFLDGQARIESGLGERDWQLQLGLAGGAAVTPNSVGSHRVELVRPGLTEWFINTTEGIEHGFDLDHAPNQRDASGRAIVRVDVSGGLRAEADPDSPGNLRFVDDDGVPVLGYRTLKVWDAAERPLEASMTTIGSEIVIAFDDTLARYPVTVDPVIVNLEDNLTPAIPSDDWLETGDGFGATVAMDLGGEVDLIAIGAPNDDSPAGARTGAVYVFSHLGSDWKLEARLIGSSLTAQANFGRAIAVDEGTVVVGAPYAGAGSTANYGVAYAFVRDPSGNWSEEAVLEGSTRAAEGYSVAIEGDTIVVAAIGSTFTSGSGPGGIPGEIMFYERSNGVWTEVFSKVVDTSGSDTLGLHLAISGPLVVVGAPHINDDFLGESSPGEAHIFRNSLANGGWSLEATLTASDGQPLDKFGYRVGIADGLAIIGAPDDDNANGTDAGSVYVFQESSPGVWGETAKILAENGAGGEQFGQVLHLEGRRAVVAVSDRVTDGQLGSLFVYDLSDKTPVEVDRITWDNGSNNSSLGFSLDQHSDYILAGARLDTYNFGAVLFRYETGSSTVEGILSLGLYESLAFGETLAIDGNRALVGAPSTPTAAGFNLGSVFVLDYDGDSWKFSDQIFDSNAASGDHFGFAVALDGDTAVVAGGNQNVTGNAEVHIFQFAGNSSWSMVDKIVDSSPTAFDRFGYALALHDGELAIGESGSNSVHLYKDSASIWSLTQALVGQNANDDIGKSLVLDNSTLIAGGRNSAHVFTRNSSPWSFSAELLPAVDGTTVFRQSFGASVALVNDTVVVGCPDGDTSAREGEAFVFFRNGSGNWIQEARLTIGTFDDHFGQSLALAEDLLVVGSPRGIPDGEVTPSGSAHVFTRTGIAWTKRSELSDSGGAFGTTVAMDGDQVLISAPESSATTTTGDEVDDRGRVFAYTIQLVRTLLLSPSNIDENLPAASRVGDLFLSDSSNGAPFTFVTGAGDDNNDLFTISGAELRAAVSLDADEVAERFVRISTVDGLAEPFRIVVNDDRSEDVDGDGLTEAQEEDLYGTSDLDDDSDDDNLLDGGEVAGGLNPLVPNPDLAAAILANPENFGIDFGAIDGGLQVVGVDSDTGTVTLELGLRRSEDLDGFDPESLQDATLEVQGDGTLHITLPASGLRNFYRLYFK